MVPITNRTRPAKGLRRRRSAASEIIGTLLILAITVALFAAVMLFVSQAQPTPTLPQDQFSVTVATNSTSITGVAIQLVSGPPITGASTAQAYVHLGSKSNPSAITPTLMTLGSGLGGAITWNPGQVWSVSLASAHLPQSDNLTTVIVAGGHLLFLAVTPGPSAAIAPYFITTWTFPTSVTHGAVFTVYATISIPDGIGSGSVKVNLSNVPGEPSSPQSMTHDPSTGVWGYTTSSAPTTAGTYTIYLTVLDSQSQTAYEAIPIQVH